MSPSRLRVTRTGIGPAQVSFTLVGSLVVVILGLRSSWSQPASREDLWREAKAKADVRTIADAVRNYRGRKHKLPNALGDLAIIDERGRSELEALPQDPWGHDYILRVGDRAGRFEVISLGVDGSENTEDDISSKPKKDN